MEKVKKPFYKRWWFFAIIIFIVLGVIFSPSEEELAEIEAQEAAVQKADDDAKTKKEAAAKQKADEKKAAKIKEQNKIDALVVAMDLAGDEMIANSNGVIAAVKTEYITNHFKVKVSVDEATWAASSESEKMSFATTIGTTIGDSLAPHETLVDIISAQNKDVVASQKVFGGWKIKR
jgi:hypothetical protein